MAAAVTASVPTGYAASLTLYYGADANYDNSNNGIFVATGYDPTGANTNTVGQPEFLTGIPTAVIPNIGSPTTINVPVGAFLSIAIDAVLTGELNAAAGAKQRGDGFTQPSYLGLAGLGVNISSSDTTGTKLTPYTTDTNIETTVSGLPSYLSTGVLNEGLFSGGTGGTLGTNGGVGYNAQPNWFSIASPGEVQPNLPGYDTSPNSSGSVGLGSTSPGTGIFPVGGNAVGNGRTSAGFPTATAESIIEAFGSANNTASYAAATDFLDSLAFKALAPGIVTLTPNVIAGATQYWTFNGNALVAGKTTSTYAATSFGAGDTITNLPALVINIVGHPIASYAGTSNTNYLPSLGVLTVSGGSGNYAVASMSVPGTTSVGTIEAKTFTPVSDEEIYALDVLVNGTQATAGQLATLVTAINSGDSFVPASVGMAATTNPPVPNPFAFTGTYNLYLDPSGAGDAFLGIDLSATNDPNLIGYSFARVAVVPEPVTIGLMMASALGILAQRRRPVRAAGWG
jgi:hypothetical protein